MTNMDYLNRSYTHLYHYTNRKGLDGILDSMTINPSTNTARDTYFGQCVYFTDVTPGNSKKAILGNNYNNRFKPSDDRADYYIKIPKGKLRARECRSEGRVVYTSRPEYTSVDLSNKDAKYGEHGGREYAIEEEEYVSNAFIHNRVVSQNPRRSAGQKEEDSTLLNAAIGIGVGAVVVGGLMGLAAWLSEDDKKTRKNSQ